MPKIVFIPKQPDAILDMARKLTPPGFARSPANFSGRRPS